MLTPNIGKVLATMLTRAAITKTGNLLLFSYRVWPCKINCSDRKVLQILAWPTHTEQYCGPHAPLSQVRTWF